MKQTFINLIKQGSIEAYKEYGIWPSLTIAQAILETAWGRSSIGNNIFGIKADSKWTGKTKTVRTHEYVNGKKVYIDAKFRDYDSIEESIRDRSKFLSTPRYKKVLTAPNYKVAAAEIHKAGYATDPAYTKKLTDIIEQNQLHLIDKEAQEIKEGVNNAMENMQNVSSWAKEAWDWAIKNKLVDGTNPRSNITREQMITVLHRYSKMVK